MPTVHRFASARITMYAADHNPPHFHIVGAGFEVLVAIGTWAIIGGAGHTRDIEEAMAWAVENEALLRLRWAELNG